MMVQGARSNARQRVARAAGTPESGGRGAPLPVDAITLDAAVARVRAMVAEQHGGHVVTLNPEIVMRARRDPGLARVIREAALVTADGAGVVWGLRLAGSPVPERVTGIDLVTALARPLADDLAPVFLLGAAPGVAEQAAGALRTLAPDLRVAGCWSGSPHPRDDAEAVARLRASDARLALVAYGSPAQDLWIARNRSALDGVVAIGVGGALDMLAGRTPRAPRGMRVSGLEWLYRLWLQPWRWRRMLALPAFAWWAAWSGALARVGWPANTAPVVARNILQSDQDDRRSKREVTGSAGHRGETVVNQ